MEEVKEAALTQIDKMLSEENAKLVLKRVIQLEEQAKPKTKMSDFMAAEQHKLRKTYGFLLSKRYSFWP